MDGVCVKGKEDREGECCNVTTTRERDPPKEKE